MATGLLAQIALKDLTIGRTFFTCLPLGFGYKPQSTGHPFWQKHKIVSSEPLQQPAMASLILRLRSRAELLLKTKRRSEGN